MKHKNPFRGIACSNGSSYGQRFFRHVEGARDTRRSNGHFFIHRFKRVAGDHRDAIPHPVSFTE